MIVKNHSLKPLLLYTMTSALGDFLIMSDVMKKVEEIVSDSRCLMAHRSNPHVSLWRYDDYSKRFFDVFSGAQIWQMMRMLRVAAAEGYRRFGLQMAPGSIQGYLFQSVLKSLGCLDYVVDFNLINADIIVPRRGDYIFDIHINQIQDLFGLCAQDVQANFALPLAIQDVSDRGSRKYRIGIHPWSRRSQYSGFTWPDECWVALLKELSTHSDVEVVLFGKDATFDEFLREMSSRTDFESRITAVPSESVRQLINTISGLDLLISVNTSVVHIGHALQKKMVILTGPSLEMWVPKSARIRIVRDPLAVFPGVDRHMGDSYFPSVSRILVADVINAIKEIEESW